MGSSCVPASTLAGAQEISAMTAPLVESWELMLCLNPFSAGCQLDLAFEISCFSLSGYAIFESTIK